MTTRDIKNILVLCGHVATVIGICITPYMVKWFLTLYVIALVAIWLHDEK